MKSIEKRKRSSLVTMIMVGGVVLSNFSLAQDNRIRNLEDPDCVVLENGELKDSENSPAPLLAISFVQVGGPTGGFGTITDLAVFNSKLFLTTSKAPLGDFGTNVFSTTDGVSYTKVLEDNTSQGYLRMGVYDNKLWIPDGDPTGLDPSYVYISSTGAFGSFTKTSIIGAVHSFDIVKFNNQMYVSNGMGNNNGGLCKYNGTNQWTSVYESTSSMRMKYMAAFNGKLFVANRKTSSDIDAFVFSGDPQTTTPAQANPVSGSTSTFRFYATSTGKLFWSLAGSAGYTKYTQNGTTWSSATTLDNEIVSDFAEFNGKLYALGHHGLWESSDYVTFTKVASPPTSDPTAFTPLVVGSGINPESVASMEVFNGALWCGSSRNGKLYKIDFGTSTSVPDNTIASNPYVTSDHSVIFQMENTASVGLRVYNMVGSLVKTVSLGMVSKGNHEIDLDELKEGLYLLEVTIGNETKGIKFIKR